MKKPLLIFLALILSLGVYLVYKFYSIALQPNVRDFGQTEYFFVAPEDDLELVAFRLDTLLENPESFKILAEAKELDKSLKPGRYALEPGMNNNTLVNRLRAGIQEPVRLTLNMAMDLKGLAGQAARDLEPDSLEFLNYLEGPEILEDFKISREELPGFFLANTYEFYWNTSPKDFVQRMLRESEKFWKKRQALLDESGLNRHEVITLASIVESETAKPSEMPRVAGLYLNRLEKNIKLQSDPTVIFAMKQEDPNIEVRRVYTKHLSIDSKYNTYKYEGLPPGPIRIPDPRSIDAVLKAEDHSYIYMCADPDRPGYHAFARTLRQHNINGAKYRNWANQQGIH